ncbi:alpha/beta hydrolase [Actinoplanes sp. NPDC051494]|uniref:alpha/beta hydrolase n=1 Tax=Actinoplanes sp. NPDC051494 TaxID=3363907 RepID=UPI00379FF5B3
MKRPVIFIHGLWIHSLSWQPWQDLFQQHGYETHAPGWPGDAATVEDTRAAPENLAGRGVAEITDAYAKVIADLPAEPILIGHSFGGLIVQKLLGLGLGAAAVAISPGPIKGIRTVPLSQLRSGLPVLSRPGNKKKAVSLTEKQFAYAFGNAVPAVESAQLYERWSIPGPGRPLFEASSANFSKDAPTAVDTTRANRGPLLLLAAGRDHTVPASVVRAASRLYAGSRATTQLRTYDDRGHSAPFDHGWRPLAEDTLSWLSRQGF